MNERTVVLLSGGLDSTTLLYDLLNKAYSVTCLNVDYGQRHEREIASAIAIAADARVPLIQLQLARALSPIFVLARSSQVGRMEAVPHGHYADDNMKTTIVPNRNMLLLSIAGALAESIGAEHVAYAAHAGDHAVYPDCRPNFATSCAETLHEATDGRVSLFRPFVNMTKAEIVRHGAVLDVPFALTYSCYEGDDAHCGKCGTCVERKEAFEVAGVNDPTMYKA